MEKQWPYLEQRLLDLLAIPSPSGFTHAANKFLTQQLDQLDVEWKRTGKGAVVVTLPGKDDVNQRTVSAHIDTLGAMVKEIKSNGCLKLTSIGGLGWANVEGENCLVHTGKGETISGTLLLNKASVHVHGKDTETEQRKDDTMQLRLDHKVSNPEEVRQLGIEVGDFVTFEPRTRSTNGFFKSRHLDDKAGVAIMLAAIKEIKESNIQLPCTSNFFFSHYEEVGHGGAAGLPPNTRQFLCIDMGAPGEGQQSDEFSVSICAKDSSGPYCHTFTRQLIDLAQKNKIPYKVDIYPYYGSDATAALRSGHDFQAALIGPGVDSSHSYERTHKDSLLATYNLTMAWLQSE